MAFGILELHVTLIRLRVDTQKKMQELISPQKGEEDPGQNHGLGPGKGQKELLRNLINTFLSFNHGNFKTVNKYCLLTDIGLYNFLVNDSDILYA